MPLDMRFFTVKRNVLEAQKRRREVRLPLIKESAIRTSAIWDYLSQLEKKMDLGQRNFFSEYEADTGDLTSFQPLPGQQVCPEPYPPLFHLSKLPLALRQGFSPQHSLQLELEDSLLGGLSCAQQDAYGIPGVLDASSTSCLPVLTAKCLRTFSIVPLGDKIASSWE